MRYSGILPIYKPKGMTSHDVIYHARRALNMKKIGHTGTLDPDVEGVLVLCLGKATRLAEYILNSPKRYVGEVTLGFSTETEDASGEVVEQAKVVMPPSNETIDQTLHSFLGTITQIPPYYSAVSVNGRRLYEYARLGESVERPKRTVQITSFERITSPYRPTDDTYAFGFEVVCSKGTYVRTLAVDVGKKLGYPAHMSDLKRVENGGYTLEEAVPLDDLTTASKNDTIENFIRPMSTINTILPSVNIETEDELFYISHGQVVNSDFFDQSMDLPTAVFYKNQLVAIYQNHPTKEGLLKPVKVINEQQER